MERKKTGRKKRKEGRREDMTREEGHLVVICVCKLALTMDNNGCSAAAANVNECILGYIQYTNKLFQTS